MYNINAQRWKIRVNPEVLLYEIKKQQHTIWLTMLYSYSAESPPEGGGDGGEVRPGHSGDGLYHATLHAGSGCHPCTLHTQGEDQVGALYPI